MKQQAPSQSVVALMFGLVVVIVLIFIGLSILNPSSTNGPLSIQPTGQSTGMSTQIEGSTFTPNAGTQKAISHATWLATTHTPFPTQVPFPTGTFEGEEVKFSAEKLDLNALNAWGGYLNGNTVVVYAGSRFEDPEQGAVEILISLPYRFYDEQIITPSKHGGVRVVAEQNLRLTLQAADGETFYFDVPARKFVASLTEVVPTATPPATLTPPAYLVETPMPTFNPYPMPTELSTEVP